MAKAVGIDLGSENLRGVVLEQHKGQVQVVTGGTMPLGELAAMPDNQDKRLAIGEKLKELVGGARLKAPTRRVCASGAASALRYLMVPPVPPWRLEMLVKYEVEERAENKEPTAYDYRILDVPDVGGQNTVLVGCCQEEKAEALLALGRQARLGEVEIDLKPLALYNAYYHGHGFDPDKTVLVVDIGAEDVTALLVRNGSLYMARTFLGGGRRFTQALADELKLEFREAEDLKKTAAEIVFDAPLPAARTAARGTRVVRTSFLLRRPGAPKPNGAVEKAEGAEKPEGAPPPPAADAPSEIPLKDLAPTLPLIDLDAPAPPVLPPAQAEAPKDGLASTQLAPPPGAAEMPPPLPAPAVPGVSETAPLRLGENLPALPGGVEGEAEKRRRQTSMALTKEAAAICAALENVISNCRQQNKLRDLKVDLLYVCGGGSRIKGLPEFMGRRMRMPVEPLRVFRGIKMDRLALQDAEALRAEEPGMAVAAGLALSGVMPWPFAFLFWPSALKARKDFWGRGAYLYYAAAVVLAAFTLYWFTPSGNVQVLAVNLDKAEEAISQAKTADTELVMLRKKYEELAMRLEQIEKNASSGHFFLQVLAELKDPVRRMPDFAYLTSVSTTMPSVVPWTREDGGPAAAPLEVSPRTVRNEAARQAMAAADAPDTFQAQARVYLRGFVRGLRNDLDLFGLIVGERDRSGRAIKPGFADLLVPHPEQPDHADNLFKDIRLKWWDKDDNPQGPAFLKEFVLEAFVEGTREEKKTKGAPPGAKTPTPAPQATVGKPPTAEVLPQPRDAAVGPAPLVQPAPKPAAAPAPTAAPAPGPVVAPPPTPAATATPAPVPAPVPVPVPKAQPPVNPPPVQTRKITPPPTPRPAPATPKPVPDPQAPQPQEGELVMPDNMPAPKK